MHISCSELAFYHVKALRNGNTLRQPQSRAKTELLFVNLLGKVLHFVWPPRLVPSALTKWQALTQQHPNVSLCHQEAQIGQGSQSTGKGTNLFRLFCKGRRILKEQMSLLTGNAAASVSIR
jgi:hypothetical protein